MPIVGSVHLSKSWEPQSIQVLLSDKFEISITWFRKSIRGDENGEKMMRVHLLVGGRFGSQLIYTQGVNSRCFGHVSFFPFLAPNASWYGEMQRLHRFL